MERLGGSVGPSGSPPTAWCARPSGSTARHWPSPAPRGQASRWADMRLLEPRGEVHLRIAAAGDVGLIGSARARAAREGHDAAFAALKPAFQAADLGFANFEMPVGRREWVRADRSPEFWQEAAVAPALARAGVGVVSVANNHAMDCGARGLEQTLEACRAAGIQAVGAGLDLDHARTPAQLEVRGRRVTVLAYAAAQGDQAAPGRPGIAPLDQ